MRRFIIVWISLMALLSTALVSVQAATVSLFVSCIERKSESGLPRVWFGYESDALVDGVGYMGDSETSGFIGYAPNTLRPGRFEKVFGVELQTDGAQAFFQFIANDDAAYEVWADASTDAPGCEQVGVYGPDGGLKTITKDVAPGCYEWSIQDDYGHWSVVATTCSQSEGEHTFVRLVLGRDNPVTDEARYRVWQVSE